MLYEPQPAVAVIGDRRQLVSALHALLENAVTYSYENSTVTVSGTVCSETIGGVGAEADEPGIALANGAVIGALSHHPAAVGGPDPGQGPQPTQTQFQPGTIHQGGTLDPGTAPEPPRQDERETVRISVADHGLGIPSRDLERIFERFYRVDHGRSRNTGGTGLGLAIVRHVANNHQGRVDVESREGEGSTFTLVLPLQQDRGI